MATEQTRDRSTEPCAQCGTDTLHRIRIEIRTEADGGDTAAFSREPYRVRTCLRCEREEAVRMNNA